LLSLSVTSFLPSFPGERPIPERMPRSERPLPAGKEGRKSRAVTDGLGDLLAAEPQADHQRAAAQPPAARAVVVSALRTGGLGVQADRGREGRVALLDQVLHAGLAEVADLVFALLHAGGEVLHPLLVGLGSGLRQLDLRLLPLERHLLG